MIDKHPNPQNGSQTILNEKSRKGQKLTCLGYKEIEVVSVIQSQRYQGEKGQDIF
jgi:hypothetical protein